MTSIEHRIPPPLLMLFTAAAMWGASRWSTAAPVGLPGRDAGVWAFGILALVFGASGIGAFRRARTTINPVQIREASRLVVTGIYRRSRNPMYVALTALLVSWACWLGTAWALSGPALFALFIHRFQILPEERVLREKFGRDYDDYRRQVRRWL